jgi:hypothetical protein
MTADQLADALWLPLGFVIGAVLLARHELAAFRRSTRDAEVEPVYVYGRARLRRRLVGAFVLAAIGGTLAAWELGVARARHAARAAAATASPADPDRRTRRPPARPR